MNQDQPIQPGQAADHEAYTMPSHASMQETTSAGAAPANCEEGQHTLQSQYQQQNPAQQFNHASSSAAQTEEPHSTYQEQHLVPAANDIKQEGSLFQTTQLSAAHSQGAPSCAAETQATSHASTAAVAAPAPPAPAPAPAPTPAHEPAAAAAAQVAATAAARMGSSTAQHIRQACQGATTEDIHIAHDGQQGFFQLVPASWLHLFIQHLPGASQAALFATSKWLAAWVLQTAAKVELKLTEKQPLTPEQTEMRRSIITQLLSVRQQGFALQLWPKPWLPVPVQLASRVTSIKVDAWDSRGSSDMIVEPISICCSWVAMTNLHTVQLIDEHDTHELCEAVEAGQLQQLRQLDMSGCDDLQPDAARLALTVGPLLEHVSVCLDVCQPLLIRAHHLTRLRVLEVTQCDLTKGIMQQLCSHPTLRHVTFSACELQGDHSWRSCNWDSLTMQPACLSTPGLAPSWGTNLLSFPLEGIKQVHVIGKLYGGLESSMQGVDDMLAPHLHKITCHPYELDPSPGFSNIAWEPQFMLRSPCKAMVSLLKRMPGVAVLGVSCCADDPCVLHDIWQALPLSICAFDMSIDGAHWAHLWQGLPHHVSRLRLNMNDLPAIDLQGYVCSTPTHVKTMVVRMGSLSRQMAGQDFTKQLYAAAPPHLQLEFSRW